MNVLEVIVLVMVVTIVVTITLAATSYAAFRVRERRKPALEELEADAPMFFERVRLPGLTDRQEGPRTTAATPLGLTAVYDGGDADGEAVSRAALADAGER